MSPRLCSQRLYFWFCCVSPNDGVAFGVEGHRTDRCPVASSAGPAGWIEGLSACVELMSSGQDRVIFASVTLSRADVSDAAVAMVMVVPTHEASCPDTSLLDI